MAFFWFFLIILLMLFAIAALPPWPYMRGRGVGYYPSIIAMSLAILVIALVWLGAVTLWLPGQPGELP